jgi:N-acylglucosamine 2-epimerase
MIENPLSGYARRYRAELLDSVIPFWMTHSLDRKCGGYNSCLDRDGTIFDPRKYVWMLGREAWMMSRLHNTLEKREEWLDAARLGVDFIRKYAFDDQGRCYFSVSRKGTPAGFQRKPYSAVFVMLALLEYSKATGREEYLDEAQRLFWHIDDWIRDPRLLGRPAATTNALADVMVQASLATELSAVSGDERYGEMMRGCVDRAFLHLDERNRVFLENVNKDGSSLREYPEGRLCSPGHVIEVCWFLLHIFEKYPDAKRQAQVLDIMEGALELGWDREFGGIEYFIDVERKPPMQLEAPMKLWWVHTEALYGLVLAYTLTKDDKWLAWLRKVDEYSFRVFADPLHGEWFGYCDRQGNVTHSLKGGAYKGCFHVPRALLFSVQRIEASSAAL